MPEYWLVDPANDTIQVQTGRNGVYVPVASTDGTARSLVIPGFEVTAASIFAKTPWMQDGER